MKTLGVIVPYRDRQQHLASFVPYVSRYLRNRCIPFQIIIIEQIENKPFNRGKLLNVGAALLQNSCDYLALHDVDMLPESVDYSFVNQPTHLAAHASQFNYQTPYDEYFGGVTLFPTKDFQKINGYSNEYWGWGVEDDDLIHRVKLSNLAWDRRNGRFLSLTHESNQTKTLFTPEWQVKVNHLNAFKAGQVDYLNDGLNSLVYKIVDIQLHEAFVLYRVDI